jgi:hypothetical protein
MGIVGDENVRNFVSFFLAFGIKKQQENDENR